MNDVYIHPTAIVSPKAQLGIGVKIAPYTIIKDDVQIGDNTEIGPYCLIDNGVRIGSNNKLYSNVIIGTDPQDLKYKGEQTYVIIGDNNTIREFATINRATASTYYTRIGNNNLIMEYCHIAHDCKLGDNIIFSNNAQIAGHVTIEDWVILSGFATVVQFLTIGKHAFIGGASKMAKDVPPYSIVAGADPKFEGINIIGLRRRGFSNETISEISNFYKQIFAGGLNITDALAKYEKENSTISPLIQEIIDFIKKSKKGVYCR